MSQIQTSALPKERPKFDQDLIFRYRRHKDGIKSFDNLWELTILKVKPGIDLSKVFDIEVISDADMMTYCLDNQQGYIEAKGF